MSKHPSSILTGTIFQILVIMSVLLLMPSCKKERLTSYPTQLPGNDSLLYQPADSVNDLIAFVDPLNATVFLDPSYLSEVLMLLEADRKDSSVILMPVVTTKGKSLGIREMHLHFMPAVEVAAVADEAQESQTPDLVETFEKSGTRYRVFRNAECGNVTKAFDSICYPYENKRSFKYTWYETSNCTKGNSYCVEVLSVIGVKYTYDQTDCKGSIIKIEPLHYWTCK